MNKFILSLLAILFSLNISSQKIQWVTLEEAVKAQEKEPKKIIMDVYTTWCGPCKLLDKNTFGNNDVANYINKNYYAVKFNAEGNSVVKFKGNTFTNPNYNPNSRGRNSPHQLSYYFGISGYPTIVFLDENADPIIAPTVGYKTPQQLELYLKFFKASNYKQESIKESWIKFLETFKPEFKG